ncbi:MAG: transposase [Abditibacteriota bacterium]|nr:transposase [Abditibacteriota bacterium]
MMITRFNEERKENAAGKGKFTTEERFGMGTVSMMGIPYGIAAERFGVSRTYYYELGQKAEPTLKGIIAATELAEPVIVLNKAFRERLVLALSCYGNVSAANIIAIFEAAFAYPISKGTIYNIMREASRKAEEAEERVSLDGIKNIATDEVFQNGEPVLTGVDLDTGYVFLAESAPDRSGETWKAALEDKKARGLNPALNVSDGGSGLVKGVREAFPAIETRLDIFHALRDLGNQVRRAEEAAWKSLSQLCDLENRVKTTKTYLPTRQEYEASRLNIDRRLLQADSLRILFGWLREYTAFSGYGYEKSLALCQWILDEMAALYPKRENLQKEIRRFRKNLPDLLRFLPGLQRDMRNMACEFHAEASAFALLYAQKAWDYHSAEYGFMEKKLYCIFGERLPQARAALETMIASTYRASSPDENVNGRLRTVMNARREISPALFPLYRMFLNTVKQKRSRRPERIGTSALERLTGQSHPNFLDALLGSPNYLLSAP